MKNLVFKKLSLLSNQQRIAKQLTFGERFNLITGKDNSVGKSTIVKNLFWPFGCDVRFDEVWKSLDCKVLLEFSIDHQIYFIGRHGDRYFYSSNGKDYRVFQNLGGELSEIFANLLDFSVLLPRRNEEIVSIPPPAFYFLPFYIEQKSGWANAWNGFDSLGQFSQWQKDVIAFHIGFVGKDYFDKTKEIYDIKMNISEVDEEIKRISAAIAVVDEFVPEVVTTIDLVELEKIKTELKEDVFALHKKQEELFEELANLRAKKAQLENQLTIAKEAVNEIEKDYSYAHSIGDVIQCPICGVVHDNTLVEKFTLLSDKDQAEQMVNRLDMQLANVEKRIEKRAEDLLEIKNNIQRLNEKYYREEKKTIFTLQNVLESVAANTVKDRVENLKELKETEYCKLLQNAENLNKERNNSVKKKKVDVTNRFLECYPSYIANLHADGVVPTNIKSPEHYRKVANSGGAAEGVRGMLAYYVAIYNLIAEYGEEVLAPLIIDTPNQHEQAPNHYESIIGFIEKYTPLNSQVFLCAMDSPKLEPLKNNKSTKTFALEKVRNMLTDKEFEYTNNEIGWIFSLTDDIQS